MAKAPWSDQALLDAVTRQVLPAMTRKQPVVAWIVDDTGIPKKGQHSVGVGQVAVSLSVATWEASLPVAWHLYLPKEWVEDRARRRRSARGGGVPDQA